MVLLKATPRIDLPVLCLVICLFFVKTGLTHAQCTCMGGAAVGGGIPTYGNGTVSVLNAGDLRLMAAYRYSYGGSYLRGSSAAEKGSINYYRMQYLDLSMAYGYTQHVTLDVGVGAYPQKTQNFFTEVIEGSGVSHVSLGGRYLILKSTLSGMEWSSGGSVRVPVTRSSDNLPQHINPSTGAFNITAHTRAAMPVIEEQAFFFLNVGMDVSSTNNAEYRYGPGIVVSAAGMLQLSELIGVVTDLRWEKRMRDSQYGEAVENTGSSVLLLSPQVSFTLGPFTLLSSFDYPLYRWYDGHQLANDFSVGMTLIWHKEAL